MYLILLSAQEIKVLEGYVSKSPLVTVRLRAHALLMRNQRLPLEAIASLVFRSTRTVTRWLEEFTVQRLASVFSGQVENENAGKLTREQKEEIRRTVARPPAEDGLPQEFWDVPKLKEYLTAVFGVVYESEQSYHFLLKFSGLSFKYPDKLSPRRNEEEIRKRMIAVRSEIAPLLSNSEWVVLAADETRVQLEAEIRRAWLKKGERTVVKTERSHEHQNYLGFLDQRYGTCQVFSIERGNQKEIIRVIKSLIKQYPRQQICIVWDNAKWHRGKQLRANLGPGKKFERLKLVNLPTYAPEYNPIEHVWNYGKEKIKNRSNQLFQDITQAFVSAITQRSFAYQI
jgi:transposase